MPTKLRFMLQVGNRWYNGRAAKDNLVATYRDYVGSLPTQIGGATRRMDPAKYYAGLFEKLDAGITGRRMRLEIYRDRRSGAPTEYKMRAQQRGIIRSPESIMYQRDRLNRARRARAQR